MLKPAKAVWLFQSDHPFARAKAPREMGAWGATHEVLSPQSQQAKGSLDHTHFWISPKVRLTVWFHLWLEPRHKDSWFSFFS